jgi:hypothetical protein
MSDAMASASASNVADASERTIARTVGIKLWIADSSSSRA